MTGCPPADCAWIRWKQKWCGLEQVSRLAASTLVTFPCCQQPCAWPWCHSRCRVDNVCSCHCTLSIRILSTQTVTSIRPVTHYGSCQDTGSGVRVATGPWKFLKVLEKKLSFFQDLESPWKQSRALKVLEFDVTGPWKSLNLSTFFGLNILGSKVVYL